MGIQPKQIEKLMGNMMNTLKGDTLLNTAKNLNTDIQKQMDKMGQAEKKRNEMINTYSAEYKDLRENLITEYQIKCKQMQGETDKQIEEIKEKYKNMNECVPSLTIEQLQSTNPFKAAFYSKDTQNEFNDDDNNKSSP